MEYDASIRINADLDKIGNYEINTESIKRLKQTTARMEKILADSFNIQATRQSIEMLNMVAKDSFTKLSSMFEQYSFEEKLKDLRLSFAEIADAIGLKQIEALQSIDFSRVFRDSFYQRKYNEASQIAFEYVEEEVKSEETISQDELLEIFDEQMENKIGWQERLYNKSEEFKKKYYVFYKIITWILNILLTTIATHFLQLGSAYITGNITSEPKKDAPVIYYFDQRTEINIIGETDNYYFITYPDNDGNEGIGYCEKENVEIIPEDNNEIEEEAE